VSKFRSSLRYKLGAALLLASLVPLVIVNVIVLAVTLTQLGGFSSRLREVENSLRSDVVGRTLTGAAVDVAADIDGYLLERIADVRRWSEEGTVIAAARQGTLAAQEEGLAGLSSAEVQARLPGSLFMPITQTVFSPALSFVFRQTERPETPFIEILVTEASGVNILITRPLDQMAHADSAWWQRARAQGMAGIGVTDLRLDAATNTPVIGLALPIVDPDSKQVLGVMRALVRLTELQRRLSQTAASLNANIRVLAADGRLIADTASDHSPALILTAAGNLAEQNDAPTRQALEAGPGTEGAGALVVERPGGREIVGYAHTSGSAFYDSPAQLSSFEGFGWGVTVTQPESRALQVLAPLIATGQAFARLPGLLGWLFAVVMALAAAMSLIAAIVIARSITTPLIEVSNMARRVQAGDLTAQVDVRSSDEVGVLAHTFNTMTAGLRERERERDIFGRVVSPEVREKLLSGGLTLGGETLWVAVVFSDIRGFSTMSEQMSPEEVVAFLNEYLAEAWFILNHRHVNN
jgi:HAMP domain-containing protein